MLPHEASEREDPGFRAAESWPVVLVDVELEGEAVSWTESLAAGTTTKQHPRK